MIRNRTNADSRVRSLSEKILVSVYNDSGIEIELIELVKALARAAARDDYRKAKDAETISLTEAGHI
jgi:hypothetical protein